MQVEKELNMGNRVFCDAACGKEYTHSKKEGGFIFGSKAYCPKCAKEALPRIRGYNEEWNIKAYCPEGMSFKDFVLQYRGDNNSVKVITLDDDESMHDFFKGMGKK